MSFWKKVNKDMIDISLDKKELEILYNYDKDSNHYISLKINDIIDLLKKESLIK